MYRMCRPADRLFLIFSIFHSLLKRIDQPEEYRILFLDMFSLKNGLNSPYQWSPSVNRTGGRSLFYNLSLTKPKTYMIRPTGRNLASISRMDHCWHMREVKTHSESNVVEAWNSHLISFVYIGHVTSCELIIKTNLKLGKLPTTGQRFDPRHK